MILPWSTSSIRTILSTQNSFFSFEFLSSIFEQYRYIYCWNLYGVYYDGIPVRRGEHPGSFVQTLKAILTFLELERHIRLFHMDFDFLMTMTMGKNRSCFQHYQV